MGLICNRLCANRTIPMDDDKMAAVQKPERQVVNLIILYT